MAVGYRLTSPRGFAVVVASVLAGCARLEFSNNPQFVGAGPTKSWRSIFSSGDNFMKSFHAGERISASCPINSEILRVQDISRRRSVSNENIIPPSPSQGNCSRFDVADGWCSPAFNVKYLPIFTLLIFKTLRSLTPAMDTELAGRSFGGNEDMKIFDAVMERSFLPAKLHESYVMQFANEFSFYNYKVKI